MEEQIQNRVPTTEEIIGTISAMRDSVWEIQSRSEIESLSQNEKDCVRRNLEHLKIMMMNEHIANYDGDDLSDIYEAIQTGEILVTPVGD